MPVPDKFRLLEIEKRLTAELQTARENLRRAATDADRRSASESFDQALQRFKDFASKGTVPQGFLPTAED